MFTANTCRACLQRQYETEFLFSNNFDVMFQSCTNLEVNQSDGLPARLCHSCANRLEAFYLFRNECIINDEILRNQSLELKKEDEPVYDISDQNNEGVIKNEILIEHPNNDALEDGVNDYDSDRDDASSKGDICDDKNDISLNITNNYIKEKSDICITSKRRSGRPLKRNEKRDVSHKHKFKCKHCTRRFKTEERCERHMRTHFGKESAECELCGKRFSSIYALEVHMNLHMGKKDFICHCGKEFFTKYTYGIHMKTHEGNEGRTFVCEKCGKGFYSKANLMGHKMVHMEETPYQCNQCPKAFKNNGSLQAHLLRHSNVRNHICAECGKASITLAELRIHMRNIHSDLRPFCCDICGKRCKLRSHLTAHMQIHTERNKCQTCGKIFATGCTLKIHQRVHTGEKPFSCTICGRPFSQRSALKTHMKVHN